MRSAGVLALAATLAVGLIAVAVAAGSSVRPDVFTLGMDPVAPMAPLPHQRTACQAPIPVPDAFRAVALVLGPPNELRGPFDVTVRSATPTAVPGSVLARAAVPRERLHGEVTVTLDRSVPAQRYVAVCVTNRGRAPADVWGDDSPQRTPATSLAVDERGRPLRGDLFLRFPDRHTASLLERIPAALSHAAPYKLGGIGAWAFWLLAALVLVGAPVLLVRALRAADADDPGR
jgi:hypothetical protein